MTTVRKLGIIVLCAGAWIGIALFLFYFVGYMCIGDSGITNKVIEAGLKGGFFSMLLAWFALLCGGMALLFHRRWGRELSILGLWISLASMIFWEAAMIAWDVNTNFRFFHFSDIIISVILVFAPAAYTLIRLRKI